MTLELLTMTNRPPRPEDMCTKIAGTHYDPACPTPLWLSFLDRVTASDKDLQAYLQRMAGYCLTGHTKEHVLFFLYGGGANGKGVFVNTLTGIWGTYAAVASMETFCESVSERHPTDLAMLRGARLVVAQETEEGRYWAEAKVKALTGGDPITARFMRQDFFTYIPKFKLVIAGNHKPSLKSVDEAIRRRFHLIPFTVTIPVEERDKDLPKKLKPEWPGILAWAAAGCTEWQKQGLNPPAVVRDATDEYLAAEDAFQQWIGECCVVGKDQWGIGAALWESWRAWADRSNERSGSRKTFASSMAAHGHETSKSQHVRGYNGINVKPDTASRYDLN
jgi:putative DNA primase/helicase